LALVGAAGVALLLVFIWLTELRGVDETPESVGSTMSTGPRGAQALYRWLEKAGIHVSRSGTEDVFPPPDADLLFMINPNGDFPEGQAGSVRHWVEDGHTLVLAMSGQLSDLGLGSRGVHPMLNELGIDLVFSPGYSPTLPVSQPLFNDPPVAQLHMPGSFSLMLPITGTLVLASTQGERGDRLPLAAMLKVGDGRVYMLAGEYPLSNIGLGEADNGAFVYNIVRLAGGTAVAFDEVHHSTSQGGDIVALLTRNPWGWAIIYAALLAGTYLVWSARRLGPPIPEPAPDRRRPTSDYVRAVAGLFRRARKPGYAAERYLRFLKRTLSRHAELDPYLTDARFVQSLYERGRHSFNPDDMLRAIERLRRLEGVGEGRPPAESVELETLQAIRQAEDIRRQALGIVGEDTR
jgi:hypothetical protein